VKRDVLRDPWAPALVLGLTAGAAISLTGTVQFLSVIGFWLGAMWIVVPLAFFAAAYAWRSQEAPGSVITLAAGTAAGLLPGAIREGQGLPAYEVWFPILIGVAVAICIAPVYIRAYRRLAQHRRSSRPGDLTRR
jgi:hypothetical protein